MKRVTGVMRKGLVERRIQQRVNRVRATHGLPPKEQKAAGTPAPEASKPVHPPVPDEVQQFVAEYRTPQGGRLNPSQRTGWERAITAYLLAR